MTHHALCFLKTRACVQEKIVIGHAQGMKIELAARPVLYDTRVLQIALEGFGIVPQDEKQRIGRPSPFGAPRLAHLVIAPSRLTALGECRQARHKAPRKRLKAALAVLGPCRIKNETPASNVEVRAFQRSEFLGA